jgi:aspartyl aminopeptidase
MNNIASLNPNDQATLERLFDFLDASPTPYHAVNTMVDRLTSAGFVALDEKDEWTLDAGGAYFTTRNGSSIIAWKMPTQPVEQTGFRMIGAHTDSPCLKVKPNPDLHRQGYWQLGVEVYGGVLLNPWFDRDLSLAGRVSFKSSTGLSSCLINLEKPVAIIPSLAIHLDREANSTRSINAQTYLPPLLGQTDEKPDFRVWLKDYLQDQGEDVQEVLNFDLCFYDTQGAARIGLNDEFLASARLDNLLSCFMGLEALLSSDSDYGQLLVCNDHEEVGSMSAVGAQGPMLEHCLERILAGKADFSRTLAHSMMISADNAHGIHPNFSDKHDANHGPLLNQGPVIKINANQRYATTDVTASLFKLIAESVGEPTQSFVVRSDMACGSTIGPITSAELGVKTLDIGVPQFGMHSIREMAGTKDVVSAVKILTAFLETESV